MKITAIVGSPNNQKSNTAALVSDFLEQIRTIEPEIDTEIIGLGETKLQQCAGCWGCMKTGKCLLRDGLDEIQNKLWASDLVILASPVYVHQVSGLMKTFVDRMFIWVHTMKLIGKPAITVTTTAQTGTRPTSNYLKKAARLFGMVTIGSLAAHAYGPGNFPKRDFYRQKYQSLARKTIQILRREKSLSPGFKNQLYFHALQWSYWRMPQHLPFEHRYWKDKNWFGKTMRQAIKMEKPLAHRSAP